MAFQPAAEAAHDVANQEAKSNAANGHATQDLDTPPDNPESQLKSIPWVSIALAAHVVLLVVAWFVMPQTPARAEKQVIEAARDLIAHPPPPQQPPDENVEFDQEKVETTDPTVDQMLVPDATDDHAEDPNDKLNQQLADSPNNSDSQNESPHPNTNSTTSATGLGGGIGGGGGRKGGGGLDHRRPRGHGGPEVKHPEQTRAALEWLKDHQNREGKWSATTFSDDSSRKQARKTYNIEHVQPGYREGDKGWDGIVDTGLTGLAMLAFTGAGYDHKDLAVGRNPYKDTMRRAALYLMKVQGNNGAFGAMDDDASIYNHAICTMAMVEMYMLSNDRVLYPACERAIEFMLQRQNPGMGWRYDPRTKENDTSVTGWMVLTLHTCEMAGFKFDKSKCYADADTWFKLVTVDVKGYPQVGYDAPGNGCSRLRSAIDVYDSVPSMDAIYVMSALFMGTTDVKDSTVQSLAKVCTLPEHLPKWELNKLDYYYWYYASNALFQVGGANWQRWENAMSETILKHQRGWHSKDRDANLVTAQTLDEHGSWDPVDAWGAVGGRVYSTAINTLTLQTWTRYQRLNGERK